MTRKSTHQLLTHSLTDNLKSKDASASKMDSEATRQIPMNKDDLLKIDLDRRTKRQDDRRDLNSLETMVSQVKEVKPMEKALQLKKEKNRKNMISQGNFCAPCKPFSNEANGVFRQQDSPL